jgi:hypothetical protein
MIFFHLIAYYRVAGSLDEQTITHPKLKNKHPKLHEDTF